MECWTISPRELHDEIARGAIPEILDVRNSDEFAAHRLEGSRTISSSTGRHSCPAFTRRIVS